MIIRHAPKDAPSALSTGVVPSAQSVRLTATAAVQSALSRAQDYAREHFTPALSERPSTGRHRHVLQDPAEAFLRALILVLRDAGYRVEEEHGAGPAAGPHLVAVTLTWDVD